MIGAMDTPAVQLPSKPAGELLGATGTRLRERRDELEPLVAEYDRLDSIREAFGELPGTGSNAGAEGSADREHAELVGYLRGVHEDITAWMKRIEPLVQEYHQVVHVLLALESAGEVSHEAGRRRRRYARPRSRANGMSAAAQARRAELKALLGEPRTRAEIAQVMNLSVSRVTELLDPLARAGEVIEIPDPKRRSRKLWSLAEGAASDGHGTTT
jgi:DNA-binding MarR family transcriptional regulator